MTEAVIIVLLGLNLVLVLALGGYVVVLLRRRDGAGQAAVVLERLDRLNTTFAEALGKSALDLQGRLGRDLAAVKEGVTRDLGAVKEVVSRDMTAVKESVSRDLAAGRRESGEALDRSTKALEGRFEKLQASNEQRLKELQEDNSKKLEQMRATVDERLQTTLETRLGESFKLVCERLDLVHKGLGEMQVLANGVGDLKKVLSNVKTRGTWGEIQLGNLLDQILTPEQYATNVETRSGSGKRVEFAIKLPGRDELEGRTVWLPIDAKFPQEDYQRLVEAQERADPAAAEAAARQLEDAIKKSAKDIHDKYLNPPETTDFAIMYLPTEGLFAEVLRRTGLCEVLQREYRVTPCGPTTLAALLNSLQMGFRTLAIEKRSSEVWKVLGAVKTEFGKFGETLDKVQKQLQAASNTIEAASTKTRTIERKLRSVQELPATEAEGLLALGEGAAVIEPAEAEAQG